MVSLTDSASNIVKCVDKLVEVLQPTLNLNWQLKTPDLDWTQAQTAIHTMRACLEYSNQVVGQRKDTYHPILIDQKDKAIPADYLPMIKTAGDMLSRLVITADKNDRAWHSYGESDPEGFAAMGVVEVSVHTYDLALGFGIEFTPLNEPSEFAIRRLFLDTVELPSQYFSNYSWGELLLWYAGRISLGNVSRRTGWKWNGQVR